uniref:eIF-2-alpha kinase GCN2 n=2 Tax=Homo sapiens TaxID=9606 RepID=UPI001EFF5DC8|nr:Chain A, eIF-2-alpha kinase GCN2 [Homo sapiens]7QQ6_B Chain B, eIF-2-alpha kinase GCN2 [Homo sapiens]7QQ6_C Chain C, eIF-2-alpha kinase GCN2 [Homo sapiens]7QQ6_D Chain D, eIF-2-alpha kinase GCN2 [Homo sapiens]
GSSETQRQFSRYFIEFEELQLLGKGAFGAVIKVQNKLDGCCYAVKRIPINPASRQFRRIKGEVTLLSRLHHENIVRYYNAWIERHERPSVTTEAVHYLYIQMEYCEKSTLRDTIDQGLYRDTVRLWRLFREILDGLAYIHEKGMIHRNLKPVNIFLDSDDHVKIGDFGLATDHLAFSADSKQDDQTGDLIKSDPSGHLTGMVGTALYVSPEVQGSTKSAYNQKVDLFSLGIIFFEMSYHPMVTASERIFVLNQLRDPTSPKFPEDFDDGEHAKQKSVISWLLNHDPAKRPTATELLKSELLPPPQMEESELHEVLHHTLT